MPADTEVETPATAEVAEKKEIAEAENKTEEKKDEEKKGDETKEEKKEKAAKEKKAKKEAPPPPPPVHKKDFEKDTVYLYQFTRTPSVPSVSPYCLKVETWLKINGIKYEVGIQCQVRTKGSGRFRLRHCLEYTEIFLVHNKRCLRVRTCPSSGA